MMWLKYKSYNEKTEFCVSLREELGKHITISYDLRNKKIDGNEQWKLLGSEPNWLEFSLLLCDLLHQIETWKWEYRKLLLSISCLKNLNLFSRMKIYENWYRLIISIHLCIVKIMCMKFTQKHIYFYNFEILAA